MNFQLRYGHECYLSHRTWTLFTKRPVTLAWYAHERRKRKLRGENYENLDDYVVPLNACSNDDEDSGKNNEDGADDQCNLRAYVGDANEDGEDAGEDDAPGRGVRRATTKARVNSRTTMGSLRRMSLRSVTRMARI